MVGFGLKLHEPFTHVIQEPHRKGVAPVGCDVVGVAGEIADHLVDAVHTDRGEVVSECAEIALRVREKPLIDVALNDLTLDFQGLLGKIEEMIKTLVELFFVALIEVPEARAIDCHHTQRARLLGRAKEAVAAL